jgi:hypothetical protein
MERSRGEMEKWRNKKLSSLEHRINMGLMREFKIILSSI